MYNVVGENTNNGKRNKNERILKKLTPFLIPLILILISCQTNNTEKWEFDNFQKSISHFQNHCKVGETITSMDNLWDITDFIDTSFLKKYKLIDTAFATKDIDKLKTLKEYHCSFIGQYKKDHTTLLLTYSIRDNGGDGNPILTATTFSDKGKLLDFFRADLDAIHDPFYQPTTQITISKDFVITSNFVEKRFKEGKEKLIMTDSTTLTQKYRIDNTGHFKLEK